MPVGITTNVIITLIGAILGCLFGEKLPEYLKAALNNMLGLAAIAMGIVLIARQHCLSAVVLALLLGGTLGELLHLEAHINNGVTKVVKRLMSGTDADEHYLAQVGAVVVLFCCGGTGWYGALNEGLTGDGSILITKAILDFVTACIFGSILGKIVPCITIPQLAVYMMLFLIAGPVQAFITPEMISDFSATGGIITFCAGLRMTGIKRDLHLLNLLPALILSFFVSAAWTALIG